MASFRVYTGTKSNSGDNELIAAPGAGLRIVPIFVMLQNNTATPDTLILYSGVSGTGTKLATFLAQNQGEGLMVNTIFTGDDGRIYQLKCGENKALVLNKEQAVATNITVWYYVESKFA